MSTAQAYLSVREVARRLTPADQTADTDKVYNWIRKGIRVGGRRVTLEAIRLPSGLAVTPQAVDAFVAALTEQEGLRQPQQPEHAPIPEPAQPAGILPTFAPGERGTYPQPSGRQ